MFTKILAGVDEATGSHDAAALADAIARACGADLMLMAAYQDPLLPSPSTLGGGAPQGVDDAHRHLGLARTANAPRGHTRAVPDDSAARALRRTARDEHVGLVVLGSSRSAPAGQARAGRTGRQVLHDAGFAVAFASAELASRPATDLRRIVVGVDDSQEALAALHAAEEIAAGCGAELTAVAVVADHVDQTLADWSATGRSVRAGEPAQQLALAALDADLLVMGSRRWGHPGRISIGSTSESLCHAAPCSVLVLPRLGSHQQAATGVGEPAVGDDAVTAARPHADRPLRR